MQHVSDIQNKERKEHLNAFRLQMKHRSDLMMNYFLAGFFLLGLIFAGFYDTWTIALEIGGMCLLAYYATRKILPGSDLYQYVLSAVFAVFMAMYVYQMHGLFEMHFIAFIGSAILITYQNWKLQIPLAFTVFMHHAIFGYLQFMGYDKIYFTSMDYMDLQTFMIHILLATCIFFICGLWSYHLNNYTVKNVEQSFDIGLLHAKEKQRDELQQANKELDKFVYGVSHDLRAPLKSMAGIIQITEDESDDEMVRHHMKLLKESVGKLDHFILDLLDYTRNTKTEIKGEEIDFKEMLDDITKNLRYMGDQGRPVDILIDIRAERPFCSDKRKLNAVLNNLISNSIRYQDPDNMDPFVQIKVKTTDSEASIVIKDNGIGIERESHQKIFDMFYRVAENSGGSGIGLYLVKETVEKLNGAIELESEPGIGTEFCLHIPNLYFQ